MVTPSLTATSDRNPNWSLTQVRVDADALLKKISRYTCYGVQYADLVHMQQQVHSFKNKPINLNYAFRFTTVNLLLSTLYITRHLDLSLIFKDTKQSQRLPL